MFAGCYYHINFSAIFFPRATAPFTGIIVVVFFVLELGVVDVIVVVLNFHVIFVLFMTGYDKIIPFASLWLWQVAGDAKGARVPLEPEVQKMIRYQIKLGKLKDGDVGFVKMASDGTQITKRDTATATTVSGERDERAPHRNSGHSLFRRDVRG